MDNNKKDDLVTNVVFYLTVRVLFALMKVFKVSYEKINVIIWYVILPIVVGVMTFSKISFIVLFIYLSIYYFALQLIGYRGIYYYSVVFLNYFSKYGISYKASSILFCLAIPATIRAQLYMFN